MSEVLKEFLCFEDITNTRDEFNYFTRERTVALIHFYKTYKPKVGTGDIKNMKKMWQVIAREMSNLYKITISSTKCENKMKVLERNYKKVIDNNNKTGRGRKTFEYEKEFEELYGKKVNIRPQILLSSSGCIIPRESLARETCSDANISNTCIENIPLQSSMETEVAITISETQPETIRSQTTPRITKKKTRFSGI